jgi:hypothetical protein
MHSAGAYVKNEKGQLCDNIASYVKLRTYIVDINFQEF